MKTRMGNFLIISTVGNRLTYDYYIPIITFIFQLTHGCKISAKGAYYEDTDRFIHFSLGFGLFIDVLVY